MTSAIHATAIGKARSLLAIADMTEPTEPAATIAHSSSYLPPITTGEDRSKALIAGPAATTAAALVVDLIRQLIDLGVAPRLITIGDITVELSPQPSRVATSASAHNDREPPTYLARALDKRERGMQ